MQIKEFKINYKLVIIETKNQEEVKVPEIVPVISPVQPKIEPQMIDYLRSGWQLNFVVAIDFTGSNGC
jgi:hypothetical protein